MAAGSDLEKTVMFCESISDYKSAFGFYRRRGFSMKGATPDGMGAFPYFGVSGGRFSKFSPESVRKNGFRIIQLPEKRHVTPEYLELKQKGVDLNLIAQWFGYKDANALRTSKAYSRMTKGCLELAKHMESRK